MAQHYNKATVQAEAYCNTCGKPTPHYVWDGRIGRCMNDHPHATPKPKPAETQQDLFQQDGAAMERQRQENAHVNLRLDVERTYLNGRRASHHLRSLRDQKAGE
jgi:hypothetical protein